MRKSHVKKVSELTPAKYNPREISDQAFAGLGESINEFGDLSGIVFNVRTGNLVTAHQRVKKLQDLYGDLAIKDGKIHTPAGEEFVVRFVDWDLKKEKAANVAANAPTIQGEFTEGVASMLKGIEKQMPALFEAMSLGDLLSEFDVGPATDPLDDEGINYKEQYAVMVVCKDEAEQTKIYDKLTAEGFTCKVTGETCSQE